MQNFTQSLPSAAILTRHSADLQPLKEHENTNDDQNLRTVTSAFLESNEMIYASVGEDEPVTVHPDAFRDVAHSLHIVSIAILGCLVVEVRYYIYM